MLLEVEYSVIVQNTRTKNLVIVYYKQKANSEKEQDRQER